MEAKARQSNFELCRLVSILLVMFLHTTQQSLGNDVSFGVQLLEGFTIIGVNVFVMITGYFSATPKKTSLLNIAFICLFWMIVKTVCGYALHQGFDFKNLFFITSSNWFIASYITLLFFTPILNVFCEKAGKKLLYGVVIALLALEIWFDLLPPYPEVGLGSQYGYSVFSFAVFYLLARAIRLYGLPGWFKKLSLLIYIICSVSMACMAYILVHTGHIGSVGLVYAYTNPLVILSSVAFLMMFERMNIQSGFINYLAKSTLACLLGHTAIFSVYTEQFRYLYEHFSGVGIVAYWVLAVVLVFVASIIIDQLRLLIWNPMNKYLKTHIKTDNIFNYGI